MRGRSIFQRNYNPTTAFEQVIQLDNVESGIYLVNVSDGINQSTKKIIVK